MEKVKKHIFIVLVVALSLFSVAALFHQGFFPIHDDEQVARVYELNYSLSNFHIPPRLSQNLGFGYDYPLFNFYPSFVYYISEIFVVLGFSFITSVKIMVGLGFVLSAVSMYLFSRRHVGEVGGLVASMIYLYAPYHSLDAYVRGAFPEFWTFVFIPAVFWAIDRVVKNKSFGNIVLLAFLGAGLMLTHNLITLMSVPFFFIYFIYLLSANKDRKNITLSLMIGALLSGLLSAFFWIPAILENKYTMVSLLTTQLANYNLHFVSVPQFINSPWGYGGSILGPLDGFSLEVGKIQILVVVMAGMIYLIDVVRKKKYLSIAAFFLIMFAFSVFMQSYYSKFIWDYIHALSYIQFPWRFMIFSVFTSAFLGGFIFSVKFDQRAKYILAFLFILTSIALYGRDFKPSEYLVNATDKDYVDQNIIRWKVSAMAFEYVPKGISTKTSALNTTVVNIEPGQVAQGVATSSDADLDIKELADKPQYKKIEVRSVRGGKITLNTFSFPGWKTYVNGKPVAYSDNNKFKLIRVSVPAGKVIVEAKFTNTLIRNIADLLTVVGIVLVFLMIPFYSRKINL